MNETKDNKARATDEDTKVKATDEDTKVKATDENTAKDAELDLKRFDVLSRYLAYEGTVFWARSTFFLGVNAGLFGLLITVMKDRVGVFDVVSTAASVLGLALSLLWMGALCAGDYWTGRWEALCRTFEPAAFGDAEVFRNATSTVGDLAKQTAYGTAGMFIATWVASLGYQAAMFLRGS